MKAEDKTLMFDTFRKNIRLLMLENDLSAESLSLQLGWFKGRIGNITIQNGRHLPKGEEMITLAKHFNKPLDDLLNIPGTVVFESTKQ